MKAARRKGWCPSALRPMASGDGLIVRLGRTASILSPQKARALSNLAQRRGNGLLDLSSRGHLQFRGVTDDTLPSLQTELGTLGLIEVEDGPAVARTIMVSPLVGIDPAALADSGPIITSLQARLLADPAMDLLPPKFYFGVDDGGRLSIAHERVDISFVPVRCDDGELQFVISLGGIRAGLCAPDELVDVALRVAHIFLDMRGSDPSSTQRMHDLVRRVGTSGILQSAGISALEVEIAPPKHPQPIGHFQIGELHALGVGLPFGRLDSATLALLADVAEKSQGELRLTPWRAVLIIGEREPQSNAIKEANLILDPNDPLRAVAACPGALGCANGTTATQVDARQLAPWARQLGVEGIAVHVSGCEKGCAYAARARVTFVGRNGLYDIVIDGRADQPPTKEGLRPSELATALHDLAYDARAPLYKSTF